MNIYKKKMSSAWKTWTMPEDFVVTCFYVSGSGAAKHYLPSKNRTCSVNTNSVSTLLPARRQWMYCLLLQDALYVSFTIDKKRTLHRIPITISSMKTYPIGSRMNRDHLRPRYIWQVADPDIVLSLLKDLAFHKMKRFRASSCRSSGGSQLHVMKDLYWTELMMVVVPESPDKIYWRNQQTRKFTIKLWPGSTIMKSDEQGQHTCLSSGLSEDMLWLNKNNNGNDNEEGACSTNLEKEAACISRNGFSKSDETIGKRSRHSYQNRRRSRNQQPWDIEQARGTKTNALLSCGNKSGTRVPCHGQTRMAALQDKMEPSSFPDEEQGNSAAGRLLANCGTPATLHSTNTNKSENYPSFLHELLGTLATYKSPSDVPSSVKEQLFQVVFLPYLDGGSNNNETCLPHLLHNAGIFDPESLSSQDHHVQLMEGQKREVPTDGQVKTVHSDVTKREESKYCSVEVGKDCRINDRDRSHGAAHSPDRTDDSLVFIDDFSNDIHSLDTDVRSPSFLSLAPDEHKDSSYEANFLGQQDDNAMDASFNYDPNSIPRSANSAMETITDDEKTADEVTSVTNLEPFTSDYVFRTVFGSSFTIPSHYWYIHPPVLPSRVVQSKVHEDGVSDKVIGKGSFGQVIAATLRVYPGQSRDVVVKEHFMNRTTEKYIIKEAKIAMYLESTGFVPICYGVLRDEVENLHIVLELFGSGKTLHDLLAEKNLPREDWLDIACQLAIGLGKIHDKDIIINDIKPDNILVNQTDSIPHVKFCDMGSASYKSGVIYEDDNMEIFVHLAPEVRAHAVTTKENDVYGLGRVIRKIYRASRISALSLLYTECMAENPTDRLSLSLLCQLLTEIYRKELMFLPITACSNGHQLLPSEPKSENETKTNHYVTCLNMNTEKNKDESICTQILNSFDDNEFRVTSSADNQNVKTQFPKEKIQDIQLLRDECSVDMSATCNDKDTQESDNVCSSVSDSKTDAGRNVNANSPCNYQGRHPTTIVAVRDTVSNMPCNDIVHKNKIRIAQINVVTGCVEQVLSETITSIHALDKKHTFSVPDGASQPVCPSARRCLRADTATLIGHSNSTSVSFTKNTLATKPRSKVSASTRRRDVTLARETNSPHFSRRVDTSPTDDEQNASATPHSTENTVSRRVKPSATANRQHPSVTTHSTENTVSKRLERLGTTESNVTIYWTPAGDPLFSDFVTPYSDDHVSNTEFLTPIATEYSPSSRNLSHGFAETFTSSIMRVSTQSPDVATNQNTCEILFYLLLVYFIPGLLFSGIFGLI